MEMGSGLDAPRAGSTLELRVKVDNSVATFSPYFQVSRLLCDPASIILIPRPTQRMPAVAVKLPQDCRRHVPAAMSAPPWECGRKQLPRPKKEGF